MNLKNERGSISLIGTFVIATLLGLSIVVSLIARKRLFELKSTKELSLCFASLLSQIKKEMKYMGETNQNIKIAFLATQSPVPQVKAAAEAAHKLLIAAQSLRNSTFPIKMTSSSECSKDISLKVSVSNPYGFVLKRDFMGVALLNHKSWSISTRTLWNTSLPNLKAELSLIDSFDSKVKIKTSNSAANLFWKSQLSYPSFSL